LWTFFQKLSPLQQPRNYRLIAGLQRGAEAQELSLEDANVGCACASDQLHCRQIRFGDATLLPGVSAMFHFCEP